MVKVVFFYLALFFGICFGQNDIIGSYVIGANNLEGIVLPSIGQDTLRPATPDNFVVEYPLPGELVGASSALINNHVMVCGGWSYGLAAVQDKCFAWFGDGECISMPGLDLLWPVVRPGYTKFVDSQGGEFLWIAGGNADDFTTVLQSSQVFRFAGSDDYGWTVGADLPKGSYGQCMLQLNATHILITGGEQAGEGVNTVYDWDNQIFTNVGDFVGGERMLHGCAKMADGRVMVAGGYRGASDNQDAQVLDTVEIFDPVTEAWSEGPNLELALDGNVLVGINYGAWSGDVLHMGGHIPDSLNGGEPIPQDTIYRFRHQDNQWELLPYRMRQPRAHFNVMP